MGICVGMFDADDDSTTASDGIPDADATDAIDGSDGLPDDVIDGSDEDDDDSAGE